MVATGGSPLTVLANETALIDISHYVRTPRPWGPDAPHLYEFTVTVEDDGSVIDESRTTFGVRRLQFDPDHGLASTARRSSFAERASTTTTARW